MITGNEVLNYLNSFGIKTEYVLHWLETYKPILDLMFKRDIQYCFIEQLYNIYSINYDISYKHFLSIIKQGEEDSFWGTYYYGKHKVLYLKSHSFKCQLGINRSSLIESRITNKMLLRSSLKMCLGALEKVDFANIDIYENKSYELVNYYYFTTSDKPLSVKTINILVDVIRELINYNDVSSIAGLNIPYDMYNKYLYKVDKPYTLNMEFIIYSRYPLPKSLFDKIELLLSKGIYELVTFKNIALQDKVDKYFNYLPIE